MGKISGWFKKSDDKEKSAGPSASNPYAQQLPVGQATPPPQYNQYSQYNNQQYNDNQSLSQPSQGPPSGLPSGPRPGGLPGRVAPGPPRTGAFESNKTSGTEKSPPPQYSSQYSPHGSQPPPYGRGSPSLSSVGGTPVIPSNTSSPSMGTGFSKEKYGAQDGVGRNRFEPAPSPYGGPAPRQGGYGNLDDGRGALFADHNSGPKSTASPSLGQPDGSYGDSMQYDESQPMTEEEKADAEAEGYKAQIEETQAAANDVGRRNYANMVAANERMLAMNSQLLQDSEVMKRAEANMDKTQCHADVGRVNLDDLDAANTTIWNFAANSKTRIAQRAEKKMTIQQRYQTKDKMGEEDPDLSRRWETERLAAKPKVLGATKQKTDFSKFEFEDDSGRQREMNEEYDGIVEGLEEQARQLNMNAKFQQFILDDQLKHVDRLAQKAELADDRVAQNRLRLDTRYNKR